MLIQVFEWESVRVGSDGFTIANFDSLVAWQHSQKQKYFDIGNRVLRFTNWVGVIQVGKLVIEILPKASAHTTINHSKNRTESILQWKKAFITMLINSGSLPIRNPQMLADLNIAKIPLLDFIFEFFLIEVETLLHRGIIKKYRKQESNNNSLKGKLLVPKNIRKNLVHKEKFYTSYQLYDPNNIWNQILFNAIVSTANAAKSPLLKAKAKELQYTFPELKINTFNLLDFERLNFERSTAHYKPSIELAKLILLNMNATTSHGNNSVISLFYDMNLLWEAWLLATLKRTYRKSASVNILGKKVKPFWSSPENNINKRLETDILVSIDGKNIVLDAKWKIPKTDKPDDNDIKQMFSYNHLWGSKEAWLCYPKVTERKSIVGMFQDTGSSSLGMHFYELFEDGKLVSFLNLPPLVIKALSS